MASSGEEPGVVISPSIVYNSPASMPPSRSLHTAFALTIASDLPLIELPAGAGAPDVTVTFGAIEGAPPPSDRWVVQAGPSHVRGWIPAGGAFEVRDGRTILLDPAAGADERTLRLAIVGPLLGVILTQRGRFVLHASTVAIDGRAAAFFGPSGRGKSTLTAALTQAGHPLIADDMTVIDTTGDVPCVQPGFPRVKLWPDSAAALEHNLEALPLVHPDVTKRSLQLTAQFHAERLPLARCYLLEDGDTESVTELAPTQSVLSLIGCTYQSFWLHESGASGPNLLHCTALTRSGVVRRLARRRTYEALPEVIRFVEEDVRSASATHPGSGGL
jgi:energy-coupling factor transporter ATP-binding protein EcfA2